MTQAEHALLENLAVQHELYALHERLDEVRDVRRMNRAERAAFDSALVNEMETVGGGFFLLNSKVEIILTPSFTLLVPRTPHPPARPQEGNGGRRCKCRAPCTCDVRCPVQRTGP